MMKSAVPQKSADFSGGKDARNPFSARVANDAQGKSVPIPAKPILRE
jgi:hypothetical protein